MEKFGENLSINEVFKDREKYIPEVGDQLEKETKAEIEIDGEKLSVDYRIISIKETENKDAKPVVLLPGFGSGWEGISELGFSLACEGRKVIMISLPGYGNSDNPLEKYYETDSFSNEAEAVKKTLEKMDLKNDKFHLIGHSMGSEIMASFAEKYPDETSSLTLLNPAGVNERENPAIMGSKFILSGIHTTAEFKIREFFSGEEDYERKIWKHVPKTKSPFDKERIKQRLAEVKKLSKGCLLKKLEKIKNPIIYISGKLDAVYPSGEENENGSQLSKIVKTVNNNAGTMEKSVMLGLRHNTTIAPDEITAANIEHYLEKAE